MKRTLISLLSLMFAAAAWAENPVKKVEQKTARAVKTTENAVKKAVKKTGDTVKDVTEKTGNAVKSATATTEKDALRGERDVADSNIYKKVETEMSKPFSPEQKQKYAEAWQAAQQKARAAEKEFAEKVSEITGVAKSKTHKIVTDSGL